MGSPAIVLATLNSRWAHTAFGLRCLLANLGELRSQAELLEFEASRHEVEIAEQILRREPRIVGLGVAIWNVERTTALAAILKRLRPELTVVLGGPEVSHESAAQEIVRRADYTIAGEGELAFAALCRELLAGRRPADKIQPAAPPPLERLELPYDLYSAEDLAHRVLYVEASRGCPARCEFCLSALDKCVRTYPLERFLAAMEELLARGAKRFKFVDRSFNHDLARAIAIMNFFLERLRPGLFLHFEMLPGRFPPELRELIARFPPGTLQLEIGIQSFEPAVARRVARHQDPERSAANLRWLREHTAAHLHVDLIAGLPGETLASFGAGFERLLALGPQEIQIELLKRLRGAPIARHDETFAMVYSPRPPYEVLATSTMCFEELQQVRRFAACWERMARPEGFPTALPLLWSRPPHSPFQSFLRWSEWLHRRTGRSHGIALTRRLEHFFTYLTGELHLEHTGVARALWADYRSGGRSDRPPCLRPYLEA